MLKGFVGPLYEGLKGLMLTLASLGQRKLDNRVGFGFRV